MEKEKDHSNSKNDFGFEPTHFCDFTYRVKQRVWRCRFE